MAWLKGAVTLLVAVCLLAGCRSPRPEIAPPDIAPPAIGAAAPEETAAIPAAALETASEKTATGAPPTAPAEKNPAPAPPLTPASSQAAPARLAPEFPAGAAGDLARYGLSIIENTPASLSQQSGAAGQPRGGGRLSCRNCHLDGGVRENGFSWLGIAGTYPRYDPRAGRVVSLEEQVNDCVVRCLNAPPIPAGSREMRAILAYLRALPPRESAFSASATFPLPERPADLPAGEEVFRDFCRACHGADGAGGADGPPLWGPDSYATGAPMHRVLTAAAFIREQMPPGDSRLSAEQAFDVAAYLNSFSRPETPGLHLDYPALTEKPIDCPYPPFPDHFPAQRHKYGPFADIGESRITGREPQ